MITTIAVAGAGTMGSGIAQVAAQSGHQTILFDLDESILEKANISIKKSLQHLADKKTITPEKRKKFFSEYGLRIIPMTVLLM